MRVISIRPLLVAAMGLVLIAASAATVFAAPVHANAGLGVVTFRLTLRGDVDPKDGFLVELRMRSTGESAGYHFFCSPAPFDPPAYVPSPDCAAGVYEWSHSWPVGHALDYQFTLIEDLALEDDPSPSPQRVSIPYRGTITVGATPQLRYLVYDYSLSLPNTAVAQPGAMEAPARVEAATGVVTFRLILRGDVDPKDGFGLVVGDSPTLDWLCISREANGGHFPSPICAAGVYERRIDRWPIGLQVEFVFERFDDVYSQVPPRVTVLHRGTVTVGPTPQVRYVVYDYSLGLPNTAAAEPAGTGGSVPAGVLAAVAALLVVGVSLKRGSRRGR